MTESEPAPRWPRPTTAELLHEIRSVVTDLPRFATAPLYRRRHLRWGATDDEVRASMPGDEVITNPKYVATRAITVLNESGDYPMMRRMLLGIRDRAEATQTSFARDASAG
jgi:hypothetical protein